MPRNSARTVLPGESPQQAAARLGLHCEVVDTEAGPLVIIGRSRVSEARMEAMRREMRRSLRRRAAALDVAEGSGLPDNGYSERWNHEAQGSTAERYPAL